MATVREQGRHSDKCLEMLGTVGLEKGEKSGRMGVPETKLFMICGDLKAKDLDLSHNIHYEMCHCVRFGRWTISFQVPLGRLIVEQIHQVLCNNWFLQLPV